MGTPTNSSRPTCDIAKISQNIIFCLTARKRCAHEDGGRDLPMTNFTFFSKSVCLLDESTVIALCQLINKL